ncbi:hypothetical protein BS47DRAFT_1340694 [Hydnum rufescens UP504]|uniref:Uncharacterized protein n=1 Tax=Hydnum rufescens UP504 TaxID=1448309 RepID=A0A9P6DZC0_9AGAM|nr:hypothetical protein BS47DRAFT_1340694 [Hydnum rufescens UP504]
MDAPTSPHSPNETNGTASGFQVEELELADVAKLLRELEGADLAARGVEGKLDNVIARLDDLLGSLEGAAGQTESLESPGQKETDNLKP